MSDEWSGVTRDEYLTDRMLATQDEADWRAARGDEPLERPTRGEMVAHFAAERAEYEADRVELEGIAVRAVVRDGWRTYPDELRDGPARSECIVCDGDGLDPSEVAALYYADTGRLASCPRCKGSGLERAAVITVHATLRLTGCGDPTREELAAQLAGIGFDTIDIEEVGAA